MASLDNVKFFWTELLLPTFAAGGRLDFVSGHMTNCEVARVQDSHEHMQLSISLL